MLHASSKKVIYFAIQILGPRTCGIRTCPAIKCPEIESLLYLRHLSHSGCSSSLKVHSALSNSTDRRLTLRTLDESHMKKLPKERYSEDLKSYHLKS